MSEEPQELDPAEATARSPMAGCVILITAFLVMVFLVVFSIFTGIGHASFERCIKGTKIGNGTERQGHE